MRRSFGIAVRPRDFRTAPASRAGGQILVTTGSQRQSISSSGSCVSGLRVRSRSDHGVSPRRLARDEQASTLLAGAGPLPKAGASNWGTCTCLPPSCFLGGRFASPRMRQSGRGHLKWPRCGRPRWGHCKRPRRAVRPTARHCPAQDDTRQRRGGRAACSASPSSRTDGVVCAGALRSW